MQSRIGYLTTQMAGRIFFGRFICAAIVSPKQFNVVNRNSNNLNLTYRGYFPWNKSSIDECSKSNSEHINWNNLLIRSLIYAKFQFPDPWQCSTIEGFLQTVYSMIKIFIPDNLGYKINTNCRCQYFLTSKISGESIDTVSKFFRKFCKIY